LVAEARKRKGDQVVDRGALHIHRRRLRHEPLGPAREVARRAIAPEIVPGVAWRQTEAMTGGECAIGIRPPLPCKNEQAPRVDERQRRHAQDDVLHQRVEALGVVNHSVVGCEPVDYNRISVGPAANYTDQFTKSYWGGSTG